MSSRNEQAKERLKVYRQRMRENANKPIPEVDEKGLYYSLLYDYKTGRLNGEKRKKFEELHEKYGKTSN